MKGITQSYGRVVAERQAAAKAATPKGDNDKPTNLRFLPRIRKMLHHHPRRGLTEIGKRAKAESADALDKAGKAISTLAKYAGIK